MPVHAVQNDQTLAAINRLRTRDSRLLQVSEPVNCGILFWKRRPQGVLDSFNGFWIDVLSGLSGVSHISIDCGLEERGEHWVMDSSPPDADAGNLLDGPQYAPFRYWTGRTYARANLDGLVDSAQLLRDLRSMIEVGAIHHKDERHWLMLLTGWQQDDLVTCASFVSRAVNRQPNSPLAKSLDLVLRKRWRWGEVTPADLARAVSMLCPGAWNGPPL